jgi:chromosome segregation ATPase
MSILTKKPVSTLQSIEAALTDLRGRQQESEQATLAATNELIGLMSAQRTNETTRAPLVAAHQKATQETAAAREALGRHLGKSTEAGFSDKLAEAESALAVATQDLARHDAQFDRQAAHTRILQLREQLQEMERASGTVAEQKMELARQLDQAAVEARKGALTRILSAYSDLLDVIEHDGIALATMRDDDPPGFDHLLRDLELTQTDIFGLIIATPDGASSPTEKGTWRPLFAEKREALKHWRAMHQKQ